jgi:Fe/S biogenesis protein NfuA
MMKTVEEIQEMLDNSVNTLLGQHRGRVEIVSVDREPKDMELHVHVAYVKMVGGCRGCAGAKYTLNLIVANHIKDFDPSIDRVVDTTDHTDSSEAYYKE